MSSTTVIDPKVIEALKDANPIEDVIGQHINLKRVGKDFVGLCPFHDEKTPSFNVSPSKQLYNCFGCGEGGDVFTFLQKHFNIEFFDAVKKLDANIEIGGEKQTRTPKKTKGTPKQIFIPSNGKLIQQPEPVWDSPKPQPVTDENWRLISQEEKVPRDRRQVAQIIYRYSETQQVRRFQWPAADKPKGRDKTIRPFYLNAGKWVPGIGETSWPAYGLSEAIDFISNQPDDAAINVLMVEGESNVEICREMGLVAVSLKTWNSEGVGSFVKSLQSTGKKIVVLGFLHDNDEPGIRKAVVVKEACDEVNFPCILINPKDIAPNIIEGGDIQEIIAEMGPEETIKRLEKQFSNPTVSVADFEEDGGGDSPTKSKRPSADAMGREIAEDYRNRLAFNNETLCWYRYEADNPGVWSPETEEYIESIIFQILKSKGIADFAPSYVTNVVKIARHELIERKWSEKPALSYLLC
ncbi:CHC2 zinc finger domain-containing protein [Kamptonema sp. UHCC 0994]|uniref:CHC2 zinc finger domain-containing protein n=1 Tax=Kamptonema sp. UHCC 0994 TaxID=3031329 RepID=UPI0023B99125|nr:CHC2 zinc finger domain-containing protein [Kamptonema sp. UHCC 0994]MDF0553152.1 CHC2 zinc finger domain-containing protein [Kamptonema sp. UHCC 0994]